MHKIDPILIPIPIHKTAIKKQLPPLHPKLVAIHPNPILLMLQRHRHKPLLHRQFKAIQLPNQFIFNLQFKHFLEIPN